MADTISWGDYGPNLPKARDKGHRCEESLPEAAYGKATTYCYEDVDGKLWATNEEYPSQVNFCPYCGHKAEVSIGTIGGGGVNSGSGSMGSNRRMQRGIESLFLAKRRRRRELAHLPIERKIRILLALQKMADDIRPRADGTRRRLWEIRHQDVFGLARK